MNGSIDFEFVGLPCGRHGPYTFYKELWYSRDGKEKKNLCLGEFFFVKLTIGEVCVCELQLLWEEHKQKICSARFYFQPEEYGPERGVDEVLAMSEKAVFLLEDLISWIVDDPTWLKDEFVFNAFSSVDGHVTLDETKRENEESNEICVPSVTILSYPRYCRFRAFQKRLESSSDHWLTNNVVQILGGFPSTSKRHRILFCRDTVDRPDIEQQERFCSYLTPNLKGRPRKKRLKCSGGHSPSSESNASEEIKDVKERNNRLTVKIKVQNHKNEVKSRTAAQIREEEDFLEDLFNFMREKKTPIERVPHLGFKQIDLYLFYSYAQNLGGYEKITNKKLWKQIYDFLGGSPGSTSAATCTRRHYERLLLPYERYVKGEEQKPLPVPIRQRRRPTLLKQHSQQQIQQQRIPQFHPRDTSQSPVDNSAPLSTSSVASPVESNMTSPGDDVITSPSPTVVVIENGDVDDVKKEEPEKENENENDVKEVEVVEVSTTALSDCDIRCDTPPATPPAAYDLNHDQTVSCLKEESWDERRRKGIHPKQRLKDENFAAKERRWDEIRRINAIERDRVRQLSQTMRLSQRKNRDSKSSFSSSSPELSIIIPAQEDQPQQQQQQPTITKEISPNSSANSDDAVRICSPTRPPSLPPPPPLVDLSRVVNSLPRVPETETTLSSSSEIINLETTTTPKNSFRLITPFTSSTATTTSTSSLSIMKNYNVSLPYLNPEPRVRPTNYSPPPLPVITSAGRPTVIQHTTSPFQTAKLRTESRSISPPVLLSPSIPCSSAPASSIASPHLQYYYQHQYYNNPNPSLNKKPRLDSQPIKTPKYYPAPRTFHDNFASSSSSSISPVSQTYDNFESVDGVLDLSMKKNRKEEVVVIKPQPVQYIEDVEKYERITPPEKELDLSVKNKYVTAVPQTLNLNLNLNLTGQQQQQQQQQQQHQQQPQHHHHQYPPPFSHQNERYVIPSTRSHSSKGKEYNSVILGSKDCSDRAVRPSDVEKIVNQHQTTNGGNVDSCLTVSCAPLINKQPYYSQQVPAAPTPSYYTSAAMFGYQQFYPSSAPPSYLTAESLGSFKDIFQPNFYPGAAYPYPSLTHAQLYHHMYKENQPYLFPPK